MRRPTIFLSSTIYDFRDLRSALKDYLELRGCTVFASDYNDFAKDLEPHAYEACLRSIEQADLYVLLIGSRVGGLTDAATRKSITRAEYERAYRLAQEGRIRIVSFVRTEVWTYRESLKELARFLGDQREKERERQIVNAPTKFMTDARTTIDFIELVSRNAETSDAIRGDGPFPMANWLHVFSTFAEIRSVLDPLIFAGLDVPQAAGRAVLYSRLTTLMSGLLYKGRGGPALPVNQVRDLVTRIGLTVDQIRVRLELDRDTWNDLAVMTAFLMQARPDAAPLVPFLSDPLLLNYEPRSSAFCPTAEHAALDELTMTIAAFNVARVGFDRAALIGSNKIGKPPFKVDGLILASALHILLRWASMANLTLALARSMSGKSFVAPEPLPRSPFVDQEAALQDERLSIDEVRAFIEQNEPHRSTDGRAI